VIKEKEEILVERRELQDLKGQQVHKEQLEKEDLLVG
jgi:hypothetical protein